MRPLCLGLHASTLAPRVTLLHTPGNSEVRGRIPAPFRKQGGSGTAMRDPNSPISRRVALAIRSAVDDRLGVAHWYQRGCDVEAYGARPKALADRVTCAGPASAPALPLSRRSSHLAARGLTAGIGQSRQRCILEGRVSGVLCSQALADGPVSDSASDVQTRSVSGIVHWWWGLYLAGTTIFGIGVGLAESHGSAGDSVEQILRLERGGFYIGLLGAVALWGLACSPPSSRGRYPKHMIGRRSEWRHFLEPRQVEPHLCVSHRGRGVTRTPCR